MKIKIFFVVILSSVFLGAQVDFLNAVSSPPSTTNEFSFDVLQIFNKTVSVSYELHQGSKIIGLRFSPYFEFDDTTNKIIEFQRYAEIYDRLANYFRVGLDFQFRFYILRELNIVQMYSGLFLDFSYSKSYHFPVGITSYFLNFSLGLILGFKFSPFRNIFIDIFFGYGQKISGDIVRNYPILNADISATKSGFAVGVKF